VVACFLKAGEDFLFLHRVPHISQGNRWGIPGGKIEKDETPRQAVLREVFEETGLSMQDPCLKFLDTVYIKPSIPDRDFVYHMYEYVLDQRFDVRLRPQEHKDYKWMSLRESLEYDLIEDEDACIFKAYGVLLETFLQE
jgi:8-oxo-dGTP pyrophosphatase MutT (NUDIX family)